MMIYRWLTWCARQALRWCYRDLSVVGAVPATGPVLLAVNHPNDLPDICAVLASIPRRVTFVANVSAAEHPFERWVYRQMGVIPVHRVRDVRKARERGEDSAAANARAFAAVRDTLAAGGCVCVFPEGGVHRGPHLGALRNGLARMALDAREGGVTGVQLVPVGLTYEAPAALRSRLLVEIGEALDLDSWRASPDRPAETQLTNRIAARLRRVTRQAPSENAAESLRALAELAGAQVGASTNTPSHQAFAAATPASPGIRVPPLLWGTWQWQTIADDLYGPGLSPEAAADRRLDAVRALAVELDSLIAVAPRWRLLLGWNAGYRSPFTALRDTIARPWAMVGWLTHAPAWALVETLAARTAASPHDVMPRRIIPGAYLMTVWYLLLGAVTATLLSWRTDWAVSSVAVGTLLTLMGLPVLADQALRWRDSVEDRRLRDALARAVPDLGARLHDAVEQAVEGRIPRPRSLPGLPSV